MQTIHFNTHEKPNPVELDSTKLLTMNSSPNHHRFEILYRPFGRLRWILLCLISIVSVLFFSSRFSLLMAQGNTKVEIVIQNFTFEFHGGALQPNVAGTIVLRNLDKVKHGFTSPFLEEVDAKVVSAGVTTYGKGIKGVHIDPGESLQIELLPNRPGKFPFRCDIHPDMKGELILLSVGAV
jgi:hypothetical protein